nr:unnamed protein product [Digitaria exilis]
MDRRGKRKKRKERGDEAVANGLSASSAPFDRRVFPTLLAAAQTSGQSSISAALAARVLRRVLSRAPQMLSPLPDSLVALLPCLLSSSCSSVAALSCEVLGAAALQSMEAGEVLASDSGIAIGLMNAYGVYSLHLTLAIEVEPPFEWEGFTHIALHCWVEKQKLGGCSQFDKSMTKDETSLYALVLHVAIRLLSDKDPIFRKACLVAAKLPSSSSCATSHLKALRSSQRSFFYEIIKNIEKNCNFKEALESIKLAMQEKNDEPFQWMCWLRHLPQGGDADSRIDFCNILKSLEELVEAFSSNPEQALVGFTGFKSGFCKSAVYEDACQSFETLLQMYRTTRNQYMSGMLALHGAHVN